MASATSGLGLPAKIAIGTVIGMVALGAILGPSLYFGLNGRIHTIPLIEECFVAFT